MSHSNVYQPKTMRHTVFLLNQYWHDVSDINTVKCHTKMYVNQKRYANVQHCKLEWSSMTQLTLNDLTLHSFSKSEQILDFSHNYT